MAKLPGGFQRPPWERAPAPDRGCHRAAICLYASPRYGTGSRRSIASTRAGRASRARRTRPRPSRRWRRARCDIPRCEAARRACDGLVGDSGRRANRALRQASRRRIADRARRVAQGRARRIGPGRGFPMQPAGDGAAVRVQHPCQVGLVKLDALARVPKSICQICRQLSPSFCRPLRHVVCQML